MMANCSSMRSSISSFISIKRILLLTLRMHSFGIFLSNWSKTHCLRSLDSNLVIRRLDGWWIKPRLCCNCWWTMLLPITMISRTQVTGRQRSQGILKSLHWQRRSLSLRLKCLNFQLSELQQDNQHHQVVVLELTVKLELTQSTLLNFGILRKLTIKTSTVWLNGMERLGIGAISTNTTTKVLSLKACTFFTNMARNIMHGIPRKIDSRRVVSRIIQ